jgi:DNA-binding transcriptional MerR regulator
MSRSQSETDPALGLRIGEVAALTGVTPRTLRYYEELGLIAPDSRDTPAQGRRYSPGEIERVRRIKEMQEYLGVGLFEIRDALQAEDRLLGLRAAYRRTSSPEAQVALLQEAVEVVERQLQQIKERIERLSVLRAELEEKRTRHLNRLAELSAEATVKGSGR